MIDQLYVGVARQRNGPEAEIVAEAGKPGTVTIATNMAGRGVDVKLGGNPSTKEAYEEVKGFIYRELCPAIIDPPSLAATPVDTHCGSRPSSPPPLPAFFETKNDSDKSLPGSPVNAPSFPGDGSPKMKK